MPIEQRTKGKLPTPGPFLAEITNHLDPAYMGSLEVALIKNLQSSTDSQNETYVVKYLSPFYGVTSVKFEGNNSGSFNDVQKSYGMWMIPPDVGSTVMVIFIDGDPNQGYWFGCVQDMFQNHMVPGIAASKNSAMTQEQKNRYNTDYVPVAEFNKSTLKMEDQNIDKVAKPVHPFADRLVEQGLLLDTVRGVTSSGARREVPSQVFGISTPGPLDTGPGAKTGKIGYEGNTQAPVSRLGGSTFVMDDGDINGQNELIRIRTRTGHQILLHNSNDLIYIGNAKGSAWVELTSHGKIDIYAKDSVSIHTEADFNFRADRDINFEAGRNIHVKSGKNMETNIGGYYYLLVDDYGKIAYKGDLDTTIGGSHKLGVSQNLNLSAAQEVFMTSDGEMHLSGGTNMFQGAGGNFNVGASGNYLATAAQVHLNGPAADAPTAATPPEAPPQLPTFKLPNRDFNYGWGNGKFYNTGTITTIMQRVPTHEPWDQHESVNPSQFTSAATDVTLADRSASGVPPNPNTGLQDTANPPNIQPGTCDPNYASAINAPSGKPGQAAIRAACEKLGVTNPYMVATMLAVAGGESGWKLVVENFNYKADRLLQVFPSVFKGDMALAQQYAGNPNNSLPEFLYGYQSAKGKGLGNNQPGDGLKYIGRGYIGLTGRGNYTKFSKLLYEKGLTSSATALLDNPELVNDPTIAGQIVVIYFLTHPTLQSANKSPGPDYFDKGYRAVGLCTDDIHTRKQKYYECFLGQLQATTAATTNSNGTVKTGSGSILTDSQGNPVKTGG